MDLMNEWILQWLASVSPLSIATEEHPIITHNSDLVSDDTVVVSLLVSRDKTIFIATRGSLSVQNYISVSVLANRCDRVSFSYCTSTSGHPTVSI